MQLRDQLSFCTRAFVIVAAAFVVPWNCFAKQQDLGQTPHLTSKKADERKLRSRREIEMVIMLLRTDGGGIRAPPLQPPVDVGKCC